MQQRVKKTKPEAKQRKLIDSLEAYREEIYINMLADGCDYMKLNEELKTIGVKIYKERKRLEFMEQGLPNNGVSDNHYGSISFNGTISDDNQRPSEY